MGFHDLVDGLLEWSLHGFGVLAALRYLHPLQDPWQFLGVVGNGMKNLCVTNFPPLVSPGRGGGGGGMEWVFKEGCLKAGKGRSDPNRPE